MQREKNSEETHYKKKHMQIQETIRLSLVTWNLQGDLPPHNSLKLLFTELIEGHPNTHPDLIVIATQQCQRSLCMSFFCEDKDQWEIMLMEATHSYHLVTRETLQGLHLGILVRKNLQKCCTVDSKSVLRAGTCNILGNKGAVSIAINLLGQSFQFINCHLAPHQTESEHRNETLIRIVDNLVDKDRRTEAFIMGDLNYRIDITKEQYFRNLRENGVPTKEASEIGEMGEETMGHKKLKKSSETRINTEEVMKYSKMVEMDQLLRQQALRDRFLPFFIQAPIRFPPTYKLARNGNEYSHTRIPGWTDRIFYRKGRCRHIEYSCMYNLFGSDHRPVIARYQIDTEEGLSIFPEEYVQVGRDSNCQLI